MMAGSTADIPPRRSYGTLPQRRNPLPWPEAQDFRILSIDGGGIRGIFSAAFLADVEERFLGGSSVGSYFDLIAGTSTGGIIALGLAAGLTAGDVRDLYVNRGHEVFPPGEGSAFAVAERWSAQLSQYVKYRYDRSALERILQHTFGKRRFGEAQTRLCIPSMDGRYSEPYIFKTPHHPDFRLDACEYMMKVALATAAAPTYFRPFEDGGYIFVDGGIWANDPVMVALVDVLTCFSVPRDRVRILSIGCGNPPYVVDKMRLGGGFWAWRRIIDAAMHLQSHNARGQAGLLIGRDRVIRVDAPTVADPIKLDDWRRAVAELPTVAKAAAKDSGPEICDTFLAYPAAKLRSLVGPS